MGGTVFTTPSPTGEPALPVPRMPLSTYEEIRRRTAATLLLFFARVATPAQAPGKPTFGDVDFHVFGHPSTTNPTAITTLTQSEFAHALPGLATALHAARYTARGPSEASFAVPWPDTTGPAFAQLDLTLCDSAAHLHWLTWLHSHGDLSATLGVSLRPLGLKLLPWGLAADDGAAAALDLHSPVAATPSRRAAAELVLTTDPARAMSFLGLSAAGHDAGFAAEAGAFAWLAESPFLRRECYACDAGADRRRRAGRPMFARFVDEFLPANPGVGAGPSLDRETVFADALRFFGAEEEREARLRVARGAAAEARFWRAVKQRVPGGSGRVNEILRGLLRWVAFEGEPARPVVRGRAEMQTERQPRWTGEGRAGEEEMLAWVDAHWEEVLSLERERVKEVQAARSGARAESAAGLDAAALDGTALDAAGG